MTTDTKHHDELRRLLGAVALGDRGAFRSLYDATSAKLFGFALRILRKDELAEDALQDAFVSIWHAASSYQAHLSAPLTWMAAIVRNKALEGRQRQAIGMAYFHALSHSEVAQQLELPIGTVKTWIRRGLDKLKNCLAKRARI